jgi:hypothetical protein
MADGAWLMVDERNLFMFSKPFMNHQPSAIEQAPAGSWASHPAEGSE